ncbi:Conserved hypothetical protein [Leptospira biflexa serovar Patoc strain 'Patoc 1 (Paris)']|jgi:tRNA threonylcarbamoyl adenosine modification protein YeaZ|uniref:Gcp-like domain-containing protein n=1 Tax=Leptospira biflexa serovar Patoc (strain Patoc 1 / ATCC 23582 / Paris) TaxID=456481 RepID=B0SK27_LEPBP|nr:Conserved hypothetical protein [Leptospira biflexa serovar Patoc strain 'Patoc 1 (Paris)']
MVRKGNLLNLLYFDTTQDWIHVAVGNLDGDSNLDLKAKQIEATPKEASFRLVEMIQVALNQGHLKKPDLIIVPNGPGSFTGIRITVTTARDLAQLWEIPVVGIDSGELYAVGMESKQKNQLLPTETTLVCLDGKQGKYYTKYFDGTTFLETKDQTPSEMIQFLEKEQITPNNWYYTGIFPSFYPNSAVKIEATNLNLSSIMQYSLEQIKQTNLKNYDYLSLLPNYIRGTYVDQK